MIEWVVRFTNGDRAIVKAETIKGAEFKACALAERNLFEIISVYRGLEPPRELPR